MMAPATVPQIGVATAQNSRWTMVQLVLTAILRAQQSTGPDLARRVSASSSDCLVPPVADWQARYRR